MLIIDGVRYEEWIPSSEDEFEQVVKEHTQEIFGEQSIYLDRKQKLKSLSGIGSIPDGYVIIPGDSPQWHIVEVELSSHPLHDHIVSQVGRFISGVNNPRARAEIIGAIYGEINRDEFLKLKIKQVIGQTEIYKFLSDLISKPPVLTIIIEKHTQGLREAISTLAHPEIEVVEFQTFTREGVGLSVHAHLFSPLYRGEKGVEEEGGNGEGEDEIEQGERRGKKVTFSELVYAGLLKWGQALYFYNTRLFADEVARVMPSNELVYEGDNRKYSKSELAKILLIKHGFKHDEHGVAGPKYWKTEAGEFLRDLEEQIRSRRGDRG